MVYSRSRLPPLPLVSVRFFPSPVENHTLKDKKPIEDIPKLFSKIQKVADDMKKDIKLDLPYEKLGEELEEWGADLKDSVSYRTFISRYHILAN